MREVVAQTQPLFDKKGLLIEFEVQDQVPETVLGDPIRLKQILTNLIGNALKFTEVGKVSVKVELETSTGNEVSLRFSVKDTGIGICREDLDKIFQAFSQADSSTTRRFGGTGLGLSISSQLVALMGGQISAESRQEEGSTFQFTVTLGLESTDKELSTPADARDTALRERAEGGKLDRVKAIPIAVEARQGQVTVHRGVAVPGEVLAAGRDASCL